jgi:uncharacterized protein (TIGR02588 family)
MAGRTGIAERVEWGLGLVCGAGVLILAGYLGWQGLGDGLSPASLSVGPAREDRPAGPGEVGFVVRNGGGHTATDVSLSLALDDGSRQRLVIDYLPGHSEATGAFVLPPGIEADAAGVRVDGYLDP